VESTSATVIVLTFFCWPQVYRLRNHGNEHTQGTRLPAVRRGLIYSSPFWGVLSEKGWLPRCASHPFAGTLLVAGNRGVGNDVNPPTGQLRRQSGVLALLADGQRQLVIGNDDPGGTRGFVGDGDRIHARR